MFQFFNSLFRLNGFDGFRVLEILTESGLDIPVIVLSSAVGEEIAVALLKAGAHDFLNKRNLDRLGPVVSRELREAANRQAKREAEAALRETNENLERMVAERTEELLRVNQALQESEAKFRYVAECNMLGLIFWNQDGRITEANEAFLNMVGYTREDLAADRLSCNELTPSEYRYLDEIAMREIHSRGICTPFEKQYVHRDGHRIDVLVGGAFHPHSSYLGVAFVLDISEKSRPSAPCAKASENCCKPSASRVWATGKPTASAGG